MYIFLFGAKKIQNIYNYFLYDILPLILISLQKRRERITFSKI